MDASLAALIAPEAPEQLHVMSMNLRCDLSGLLPEEGGTRPGEVDHWPERRPALIELLARERPALLGVQEALHGQLSALEEALPGHRRIGYGREGGSRGEHAAILYDAERFEVLAWDQSWLSDAPEMIGSTTWGHAVTRIVVQVHLRDRDTGRELLMVNTHLDHESEDARVRSARVLAGIVAGSALPTIVVGDFNAAAHGSEAYRLLVTDGSLVDTWDAASSQLTPAWGTFPDYESPTEGAERIDWILASDDITAVRAAINVSTSAEGRRHSDHAAVQALLDLP